MTNLVGRSGGTFVQECHVPTSFVARCLSVDAVNVKSFAGALICSVPSRRAIRAISPIHCRAIPAGVLQPRTPRRPRHYPRKDAFRRSPPSNQTDDVGWHFGAGHTICDQVGRPFHIDPDLSK